jgi:hypothetical protein
MCVFRPKSKVLTNWRLLGKASLSILSYDPDHPNVPIIALWNAFSHDMLELSS